MPHLYLRLYITIGIILILFTVISSLAWWLGRGQESRHEHLVDGLTRLAERALPATGTPPHETRSVLLQPATGSGVDLTLLDANTGLIASTGLAIELPENPSPGWVRPFLKGPTLALKLPDGRWLVGRHHLPRGPHSAHWLLSIVVLAIAVAIGA